MVPPAPGAILHDHGLAQPLGENLRRDPRQRIGRAAWREAHQQLDRPLGERLRAPAAARERQSDSRQRGADRQPASESLVHPIPSCRQQIKHSQPRRSLGERFGARLPLPSRERVGGEGE